MRRLPPSCSFRLTGSCRYGSRPCAPVAASSVSGVWRSSSASRRLPRRPARLAESSAVRSPETWILARVGGKAKEAPFSSSNRSPASRRLTHRRNGSFPQTPVSTRSPEEPGDRTGRLTTSPIAAPADAQSPAPPPRSPSLRRLGPLHVKGWSGSWPSATTATSTCASAPRRSQKVGPDPHVHGGVRCSTPSSWSPGPTGPWPVHGRFIAFAFDRAFFASRIPCAWTWPRPGPPLRRPAGAEGDQCRALRAPGGPPGAIGPPDAASSAPVHVGVEDRSKITDPQGPAHAYRPP